MERAREGLGRLGRMWEAKYHGKKVEQGEIVKNDREGRNLWIREKVPVEGRSPMPLHSLYKQNHGKPKNQAHNLLK